MLYQCITDYAVLTEQVHDEKTHSTPADDATDVNSLRWNLELQESKLVSVITTTQLATWMTAYNKFL